MITGATATNRNIERLHALTAPIRSLPFIPSDFSATISPAGTIVEMQAVVTVNSRTEAASQQPMLEVLA